MMCLAWLPAPRPAPTKLGVGRALRTVRIYIASFTAWQRPYYPTFPFSIISLCEFLVPYHIPYIIDIPLFLSSCNTLWHYNMPRKPKNPTKEGQTDNNTRCSWSSSDDATLVCTLREQKDNGNQSGAGWKPQVWQAVADAIKAEGTSKGAEKVAKKCADHWANVSPSFSFCMRFLTIYSSKKTFSRFPPFTTHLALVGTTVRRPVLHHLMSGRDTLWYVVHYLFGLLKTNI